MKAIKNLDLKILLQERQSTKLHLLANPNHFGTIKDKQITQKFKPKIVLGKYQSYYEELLCVDYDPKTEKLGAVVSVKQANGYSGSLCSGGGSREYIRFFVDYNNNGNWVDEGMAEFGVYDHPFSTDLCYYASIKIDPNKKSCCKHKAVLPRVRAILSWNIPPTAGNPNFPVIWGDVKEASIQIAPRNSIWCYIIDVLQNNPKLKIPEEILKPDFEDLFLPNLKKQFKFNSLTKPSLSSLELKKIYNNEVPEGRIALATINAATVQNIATFDAVNIAQLLPDFKLDAILDQYKTLNFNTTYEEIHCVALNRDQNTLHASVQVKKSSGFSGNMCTEGSKEYVAFYMDFGSGWVYMGTKHTAVHDIPNIPKDGLWYDVALGVDLESYQKEWCNIDKAKVRAILSWNEEPTPNDPNYKAKWGDWEECEVELKPLPKGVIPGQTIPVLEKLGGMVVTDIIQTTGLATTTPASTSLGGALKSPFYGKIKLQGAIFGATPGMKYRIRVTEPGSATYNLLATQSVQTDTLGSISTPISLIPDASGWMDYLATTGTSIVDTHLGNYYTKSINGDYAITIEAKDSSNIIYIAKTIKFKVNKDRPDVAVTITSPGGDCGDFISGNPIAGAFTYEDAHAGALALSVTPNNGASVAIDGFGTHNLKYAEGTLANGFTAGTFVINTVGVKKCGYNIRIDATDRTIVNSATIGFRNNDIKGFCLREN